MEDIGLTGDNNVFINHSLYTMYSEIEIKGSS